MIDFIGLLKMLSDETKTDLLAGVLLNLSRAVMENTGHAEKLAKIGMLFVLEMLGHEGAAEAGSRFELAFEKAENMFIEKSEIDA